MALSLMHPSEGAVAENWNLHPHGSKAPSVHRGRRPGWQEGGGEMSQYPPTRNTPLESVIYSDSRDMTRRLRPNATTVQFQYIGTVATQKAAKSHDQHTVHNTPQYIVTMSDRTDCSAEQGPVHADSTRQGTPIQPDEQLGRL